jgi:hypothetical protein
MTFNGHLPPRVVLRGAVDHTHAAGSEDLLDDVVADATADQRVLRQSRQHQLACDRALLEKRSTRHVHAATPRPRPAARGVSHDPVRYDSRSLSSSSRQ